MSIKKLHDGILTSLCDIQREFHFEHLSKKEQYRDDLRPSYLIVLGFDPAKPLYNSTGKHISNTANGTHHSLIGCNIDGRELDILKGLAHEDGAILIGNKGTIQRIGSRLLNNIEPAEVIFSLKLEMKDSEWASLGFAHRVDTRHINALYASYLMEGTVVYTLSAKTGIIRAYKDGRIIYSDQKLEVMHRENPIMVSAIA